MGQDEDAGRWRTLPSVRALIEEEALAGAREQFPHEVLVEAARSVLARARDRVARGEPVQVQALDVVAELQRLARPRLRRVINATGVVLHTNLGRAPLAPEALAAIVEAAGYTNLELRLDSGTRGGRDEGVHDHVRALTGAEAAFAVNNCAAATLLTLSALAAGREVIVSRGELVEIGGGFRVPEVLEQSGCTLVEVGTTNRTRLSDYEKAFSPDTAAILRVHRSNFALIGFTGEPSLEELGRLARSRGVPLLYDQGTGEPDRVAQAVKAGADVITFSGDKLLGGPQAGLVAGQAELIERIRRHPLARALRVDKLTLAALEATLGLWRTGRRQAVPSVRMLEESADSVQARAEALGEAIGQVVPWMIVPCSSAAGGGTRPEEVIKSYAVSVRVERAHALAAWLRQAETPVLARVADGAVLLDLRTVEAADVSSLARSLVEAFGRIVAGATAPQESGGGEEETVREASTPAGG